jgi:outer membrane biosynthesis protein TonB
MRAFSGVCLLIPLLLSAASCAKQVEAEFPRPPATATLPPPAEKPEEVNPEPLPAEPVAEEPVESVVEEENEPPPKVAPPHRETAPMTEEEPAPAEPPSTTLAGSGDVDPELASKLERASTLLLSVSQRSLTAVQADQLLAARGFVAQARQALAEGDPRRALVLIDKGLILAEDVDRLSRP